jgi:hypothetical protein
MHISTVSQCNVFHDREEKKAAFYLLTLCFVSLVLLSL